tara:strand:- start:656 stop:976 length:321 start_codon:yes stop_codon:yes gene_type:complete
MARRFRRVGEARSAGTILVASHTLSTCVKLVTVLVALLVANEKLLAEVTHAIARVARLYTVVSTQQRALDKSLRWCQAACGLPGPPKPGDGQHDPRHGSRSSPTAV